jgi:Fe-S-cluster formation regulator IscX/YfhJ
MFSKYLDYSEPAHKAHLQAQGDCEQKDVLIAQLKNEVCELRQLEGDFHRLNELINSLEGKYSLLLAEKERAEREQR